MLWVLRNGGGYVAALLKSAKIRMDRVSAGISHRGPNSAEDSAELGRPSAIGCMRNADAIEMLDAVESGEPARVGA